MTEAQENQPRAREPGDSAPADGPGPDRAAAVSLMITRRQRAALRELGQSDAMIREMTPDEAHRLLRL